MDRGGVDIIADDWDGPLHADFSADESQYIANAAIADLSFLSPPGETAPPQTNPVPLRPEAELFPAMPTRLGTLIRIGLVLSVAVHGALLASAFIKLDHVEPLEAGDIASIAIDIVPTSSVSSNAVSAIQSDATEDMVSAGAEEVEPVEPEQVEPVDNARPMPVEAIEPVEATQVAETPAEVQLQSAALPAETDAEPITPASADDVLRIAATEPASELESVAPAAVEAVTEAASGQTMPELVKPVNAVVAETIEPQPDAPVAPIPATRTVAQRKEPTYPARPRRQQRELQKPTETRQPSPPRQQAHNGNNGNAQADSAAGRQTAARRGGGGSGSAAANRYPGQILSRLRRALRYPAPANGAQGEVSVQFVVSANGGVSGIRIVASSGNAVLDRAAIETVNRAAPFPPIPAETGRPSWAFTMPLGFVRR